MIPPAKTNVVRTETESVDLGIFICKHELASALADLAGASRRAAVPDHINDYAGVLWDKIKEFPECRNKESK